MDGLDFIRDLAVITGVAAAAGWLCRWLGLSGVVGYLLAGIIIGPHTPPFALVSSVERVRMLADFGLVFLMFSVGMGLSLARLKRLGLSLVLATVVGALLVLNLSRVLGALLGWGTTESLFLAAMLMVSSSAIIAKVLEELGATHERWGQLALGVTVLEDVVAVVMLTLLTSLVRFGGQAPPPLGPTLGKLAAFVVFLLFLSLMFVPRLLRVLGRQGAGEIRTLWVVGLVLTMAWLATQVGYSLALGAFLLGAIVAGTPFKAEIERSFEALRQTFGTVFFVAVGMLFDFRLLATAWPLVLVASALALLGRPVACALGLLVTGNPNRAALQAGLALTPLGEFSFIIAQLGVSSGAVPESFSAMAVGASLLTAVSAPILIRRSERIATRIEQAQPRVWRAALQAYHERLEEIRARRGSSQLWRLTGWRFGQLALHVFFLSALLLFWQPAYRALAGLVDPNSFLHDSLPFLFWSAFGILLLGPLIGLWLNIEAVAMILAEGSLKLHPRRRRAQPWIERGLKLIGALLLADWLLTLLPLGGASPWTVAGVGGVLVVAGLVFGRRLLRWHSRAEGELRAELRAVSSPAGAAGVSLPVLTQPTGWNLEIAEVTLPFQSSLAGQRIRDTALRKETGASILTLDRQGYTWINPGPDERLYPGDRLLLLGSPEQLPLAEQRLTSGVNTTENRTPMADLTSQTVRVPTGCPRSGVPLANLPGLRALGVLICGIQRGRDRRVLPGGGDHFEAGDQLLVVGTHDQILAFQAWLEGIETPAP